MADLDNYRPPQPFICPDWDVPGKDLLRGCGRSFEGLPDYDNLVDCPHCGMFFDPDHPMNKGCRG